MLVEDTDVKEEVPDMLRREPDMRPDVVILPNVPRLVIFNESPVMLLVTVREEADAAPSVVCPDT